MKNKIMIGYMGIATVAIIVLMILFFNLSGENNDLRLSLDSITPAITQVIITPEPTKEPVITPTATPSPTQTPVPTRTPYEPDEDDIAFMNMVIEEGRTITLKISEWDMINIFCDKMGFDEYKHSFMKINEEGIYYLGAKDGSAPIGNCPIWYGLMIDTGDIVELAGEYSEPKVVGNIFYNEVKEEPFRLPSDDVLIEIFIDRILKDDYINGEMIVTIGYTLARDMYFYVENLSEDTSGKDYWVDYGTWEVWDEDYEIYYGTLFD